MTVKAANFSWKPLSPDIWPDFEALFGPKGACAGCWCMYWRIPRSEFNRQKGEGNRRAMRTLVEAGATPGIIGYVGDEPAGWCSVAPREQFPGLDRARTLKRVDDREVWSVVCLFVRRDYRRKGLSTRLLEAAVEYVGTRGGELVEGYPVVPANAKTADPFLWTGIPSAFEKAGFSECARPTPSRRIVRRPAAQPTRPPKPHGSRAPEPRVTGGSKPRARRRP